MVTTTFESTHDISMLRILTLHSTKVYYKVFENLIDFLGYLKLYFTSNFTDP